MNEASKKRKTVRISKKSLMSLLSDNDHLQKQVTQLVTENRELKKQLAEKITPPVPEPALFFDPFDTIDPNIYIDGASRYGSDEA